MFRHFFSRAWWLSLATSIILIGGCWETAVAQQNCHVYFANNSYELTPEAIIVLNDIIYDYRSTHPQRIFVVGYTDRTGTVAHNLNLSKMRALTVSKYIIQKGGVEKAKIKVNWNGEYNLPFPTKDGVHEPFNRCVKIY